TMRSDFFGECARFEGLAEAVCESIYLCPRLSRDQIIAAIEGPARVFGGRLEPALAARIANDMGVDPDQLPLMQHALMRLWEAALLRDRAAPLLRLDDYLAAGGLKASLSRHADEILAEVTRDTPERTRIARHLFCLLTAGEGERAVRRLAPVAEVAAVSEQPIEEVACVADAFRAPGRRLLMPPPDEPVTADTVLDISHESLIRQWDTLKEWEWREAESVRKYREAEGNLQRWIAGQAVLWQPQELRTLLDWRAQERPNAAWAARYGGPFSLVDKLLERSRVQWKMARYGVITAIFGLALLAIVSVFQKHELNSETVIPTVFIALCLGMTYRGILINFSSARIWAGILASLFILAWMGILYNLLSGKLSLVKYELPSNAVGILEIACFVFVFLQLRRLAFVRHERRWPPLKRLWRLWPRERRAAEKPVSIMPPVTSPGAQEQAAADAPDL